MICQFCNKEFSSKITLYQHQQKAKYCLTLQGVTNSNYQCDYCEKSLSTRERLITHINICKNKQKKEEVDRQNVEKDGYISKLEAKILEKDGYISKLEAKMLEKDGYISKLEAKMLEKDGYISKLEAKVEKMEAKLENKLEKLESAFITIALEANRNREVYRGTNEFNRYRRS